MSVDTTFEAARARTATGDLAGAAAIYRQLLDVEPGNYKAWNNLGRVYDQQGQIAGALEAFTRAAELAPEDPTVLFNYAGGLHRAGEFAAARTTWLQLIRLDPENADGHYNLAAAHHRLDQLNDAIAAYREATRLRPDFYEAWSNLGGCLFEADAHLHSFEASMEASMLEQHPVDFFNMGRIAELCEDRENAARHYRTALELDPADTGTRLRCAEVLAASGAVDDAVRVLRNHPFDHPLLSHTLNAISGEQISRVPPDYVQTLFDGFAGSFDKTLARLGYRGPEILRAMINSAAEPQPPSFPTGLDLGCGTGLLGAAFTDCCSRMTGVDLSAEMLNIARAKGIYDTLVESDLIEYLETTRERFDLVTGTDVFNYFGDLAPLLAHITEVQGGPKLLAFSVEDPGDAQNDSYRLQPNGRYQHAGHYVREALANAGYELLAEEVHVLRHERRKAVTGRFFCVRLRI